MRRLQFIRICGIRDRRILSTYLILAKSRISGTTAPLPFAYAHFRDFLAPQSFARSLPTLQNNKIYLIN